MVIVIKKLIIEDSFQSVGQVSVTLPKFKVKNLKLDTSV